MKRHLLAVGLVTAALLAACGGGPDDPPDLELFTGWVGDDAERLADVVAGFEEATGFDVAIVGSSELEVDLLERVSLGDPPDVALVPQPGLVADLVRRGVAVPLPDDVAAEIVARQGETVAEIGRVDGRQYGALARASVKGLLWYSPARLAERGLTLPTTLEELQTLVDGEAAKGRAVWCLGLADGTASGWPGTDWIENLVLRRSGTEVYDEWAAGTLRFDDPAIAQEFRALDRLVLDGVRLFGGRRRALTATWQEAVAPLTTEPGCVFLNQASFAAEATGSATIAPDGDLWITPMPPAAGQPARVEIAGNLTVTLSDAPAAAQLVGWLISPEAAERWGTGGGTVVPGADLPDDSPPLLDELASIVDGADALRFDASDLMTAPVGQGTFWEGMLRFVGSEPLDSVLAYIQSGYDEPAVTVGATDDG